MVLRLIKSFLQQAKKKTTIEPQVDWAFIRTLEGYLLKGYVPKDLDVKDKTPSGVTIVGGFDLGQHSALELFDLNLPIALFEKLMPYAAITGDKARALIKSKPLLLTPEEGDILDRAVKASKLEQVMDEYNANSELEFLTLPRPVQTVITSVAFQYGSLKQRTPNFFKTITSGDWNKAYNQLLNFGDAYKTRRRQEAEYLKKGLTK